MYNADLLENVFTVMDTNDARKQKVKIKNHGEEEKNEMGTFQT